VHRVENERSAKEIWKTLNLLGEDRLEEAVSTFRKLAKKWEGIRIMAKKASK